MSDNQKFEEVGPLLTEAEIHEVEARLMWSFPTDYFNFLLKYNGGRPDLSTFKVNDRPADNEGVIQVFFGVERVPVSTNLIWNFQVFSGRVPDWLIPIGREDGGNLICLSRRDPCIYYWDHDLENQSFEKNILRVGDNWNSFLKGLYAD